MDPRTKILDTLDAFVLQRPGLDPRDYISHARDDQGRKAYAADARRVAKQLNHAKTLLSYIRPRKAINANLLQDSFRAFSGRLTWDGEKLEYCAGQYFPTEYRASVCAVLSAAIWAYYREILGLKTGQDIRAMARRDLPTSVAREWFK